MDSYEIIVSPDAEADLTELRNYRYRQDSFANFMIP